MTEALSGVELLERAARAQADSEKAARALAAARTRLVLSRDARGVFFATLALRLDLVERPGLGTAATDGRALLYDPAWVAGLKPDEVTGVLAHEVLHLALKHHTRQGPRQPKRWNAACDLAINPLLEQAGFALPRDGLFPGRGPYAGVPAIKAGMGAEAIYPLLPDPPQGDPGDDDGGGGDGGEGPADDPGGCGGVRPPGDGGPAARSEEEARTDVGLAQALANAQKARGELPAGLARLVDEALRPRADWREVLRDFLTRHTRDEYRWSPPNRRFVAEDLYLPGRAGEGLGEVLVAVDTSGSIGARELAAFAGEVEGVLAACPARLTVLYHDARVAGTQVWEPGDGPLALRPAGGGGTSHVCVFEHLARLEEPPACVVCLTDLYTQFPGRAPDVPVLWAVVGGNPARPPFGQKLDVPEGRDEG